MIQWQEKLEGNSSLGFSVCTAIGKLGTGDSEAGII